MADLLLDLVTQDLVITDDLSFTTGIVTVRQKITLRSQSFKGEWFADLDNGLLEMDTTGDIKQGDETVVLGGKFEQAKLTSAFRKMLSDTEGVDEIIQLAITFDGTTRKLSADWEVRAGEEFISGSLDI